MLIGIGGKNMREHYYNMVLGQIQTRVIGKDEDKDYHLKNRTKNYYITQDDCNIS